jgi:hypothetical protein
MTVPSSLFDFCLDFHGEAVQVGVHLGETPVLHRAFLHAAEEEFALISLAPVPIRGPCPFCDSR